MSIDLLHGAREEIRELATSIALGRVVADSVPEGSYLQIVFDTGVASGTSGEISLPAEKTTFYILRDIYLEADDIIKPQLYATLINGSEIALIQNPQPGMGIYIEALPVIRSLKLYAELVADATDIKRVRATYSGYVIRVVA